MPQLNRSAQAKLESVIGRHHVLRVTASGARTGPMHYVFRHSEPHVQPQTGVFPLRRSFILSIGVIAVACAPKADTPVVATPAAATVLSAAALDSVKAVDSAFAAGINARDTAAVFAAYAPDARVMPQDSPALVGAEAHPMLASLIAGGASDMTLHPTTVYGVGDLAYTVGTASMKMGGAVTMVKYTEVLRRGADGKWRYVVDMFSNVAPEKPPTAATRK